MMTTKKGHKSYVCLILRISHETFHYLTELVKFLNRPLLGNWPTDYYERPGFFVFWLAGQLTIYYFSGQANYKGCTKFYLCKGLYAKGPHDVTRHE